MTKIKKKYLHFFSNQISPRLVFYLTFSGETLKCCSTNDSVTKIKKYLHFYSKKICPVFYVISSGETLKCYSTNDSVAQQQWTQCDDRKGFRTCFTKYNMSKFIFLRRKKWVARSCLGESYGYVSVSVLAIAKEKV